VPPAALAAAPGAALGAAVERAESEILRLFSAAACNAGSTLLAALLLDDKLHVANVGDSRAVLARGADAIQITTDHKPCDEAEAARIAREHGLASPTWTDASGGDADDVSSGGGGGPEAPLPPAAAAAVAAGGSVVSSDGYLYGELAVARAIGSQHLKRDPTKRAFTHHPDIHSVQLAREDDMLLLATDGLWDKVDNSEAVTAARRCLAREKDAGACARVLADRAVRHESLDNISVVVVCLHDRGVSLPKTNSMLFRRLQAGSGCAAGGGGGGSGGGGGCGADGASRPATPGGSGGATPAPAGSPSGAGPGSRCETPPC
jgi:serine/threonine protein phosphatase PrpC